MRYAVVGAGWIAQEDFMPGVEKTGNSIMTALVTGDTQKGRARVEAVEQIARTKRPTRAQVQKLPASKPPELINAKPADTTSGG